jgi:dethiobiotin synthetase
MILFVTAIDTGVGKTYTAGLIARHLIALGHGVVTQKLVQTGCSGVSEDIALHRRLMDAALLPEDLEGVTCPYRFRYPASPHLAARMEGVRIDAEHLAARTKSLAERFEDVVLEGVGGLCVPLNHEVTVLDYLANQRYPTVLVTSPVLGSINHTLLSIEALATREIPLCGLIYNRGLGDDPVIAKDSRLIFEAELRRRGLAGRIVDLPSVNNPDNPPRVDFSPVIPLGSQAM